MGFTLWIILIIAYMFFGFDKNRANTQWEKGFFSSDMPYNRDSLMEAYISLGARFIIADRQDRREKIVYMNKYFNRYFPQAIYNFSESLVDSLKNPIKISVVGRWLKYNLPQREKRMQVLYFLAGIAMIDGSIGAKETALLTELNEVLGLTKKDLDSVLAMYQQKREEQSSYRQKTSISSEQRAIQLSSRVLGVSEHASMDEIKKAYRKLAKLHHPDKFATESSEQQRIAKDRFMEVQKAYDILEKYKF